MSIFGLFGQTNYDVGAGPFFKFSSSCGFHKGVDYKKIAADEARDLNRVYTEVANLLQQARAKLSQPGAEALTANLELNTAQNKVEELRQQILKDEPHQSYNCPDPGWYASFAKQFEGVKQAIQKISSDIDNDLLMLQRREQQIATETAPSSGTEAPANQAISSQLLKLKQQIEARRKQKMAKLEAIRSRHSRQAAYGRDTVQARPKSAGYATEAERLIGGRTGYGEWSKKKSVCLATVITLGLAAYFFYFRTY